MYTKILLNKSVPKPKISVIMSVFNNENSVLRSIQSILNQSFQNFEFIIINDGSTDNSKKIIKSIKHRNKKIKFFDFKKNKGLTKRLNFAICKSKGLYIARMDADDFSKKNRLKIQKKFLDRNKSFELVGSNAIYIDKKFKFIKKTNLLLHSVKIKDSIYFRNPLIHSTVFARKNFFLRNPYNPKFRKCQDYELWIRTADKYKFKNLKIPLIERYDAKNFNFDSLFYSIFSRLYNFKISKFYQILIGTLLDISSYCKLKFKKVFL